MVLKALPPEMCARVAPALRQATDELALSHLARQVKTRSVWTIDVAHLLASYGVAVVFATTTIGVHPAYHASDVAFYSASMTEDAVRVDRLFDDAAAKGIRVVKRSLTDAEFADTVVGAGAARGVRHLLIVLCDKRRLGSATTPPPPLPPLLDSDGAIVAWPRAIAGLCCGSSDVRGFAQIGAPAPSPLAASPTEAPAQTSSRTLRSALADTASQSAPLVHGDDSGGSSFPLPFAAEAQPPPAAEAATAEERRHNAGYTGHYVVVSDYDPQNATYLVSDPATRGGQRYVPAAVLNRARRAFGTDEDLLLIPVTRS